jgi:hypothetical protein
MRIMEMGKRKKYELDMELHGNESLGAFTKRIIRRYKVIKSLVLEVPNLLINWLLEV